jgi:KipI family sensor histidine kinase inhibitor
MTPEAFGDTALVLQFGAGMSLGPATLAAAICGEALPAVIDVVASIDRVTVIYDIARIDRLNQLNQGVLLEEFAARLASIADGAAAGASAAWGIVREIPVCYGGEHGPDLEDVCRLNRIDRSRFISLHTSPDYLVEAIGFVPGFPYLGGLLPELAAPRRMTPRLVVPAGSVGIGGGQTGIYPFATPGGWNIVGRSAVRLFDVQRQPTSLLEVGDRVRFVATDAIEGDSAPVERVPLAMADGPVGPAMRVSRPGLMTTIQDLGRPGHRGVGVPVSGAADRLALRLANLIVGNPEGAAGLECTLIGPELTFECDAVVALGGAEFSGLPGWRPIRVAAGETLAIGQARRGCRGYLAIAGGIQTNPELGSRSTYLPARLGGLSGSPLAEGDRVPILPAAASVRGSWSLSNAIAPLPPSPPDVCMLRVVRGGNLAAGGSAFWNTPWRTSSRSDRMGVRLEGPSLPGGRADLVSAAVLPGTIQLPPDGQPIILLADAQTIGGYAVGGHVIAADLRLAGQLRPGSLVMFRPVTIAEAHEAFREQEAEISSLREAVSGRVVWNGST